jgi:hypothetical protein
MNRIDYNPKHYRAARTFRDATGGEHIKRSDFVDVSPPLWQVMAFIVFIGLLALIPWVIHHA